VCHGDAAYGSTVLPDLRRSGLIGDSKGWATVVNDGALKDNGMVSFANVLTKAQIESVRHYVINRANEDKKLGIK
jgi:alcohol dehydrogenase (cytochrome c)/quinohemoprotein ethanol dehydrogenase